MYRLRYVAAGRSHKTTLQTDMPLEHGQWLTVDGVHLVVERIGRFAAAALTSERLIATQALHRRS